MVRTFDTIRKVSYVALGKGKCGESRNVVNFVVRKYEKPAVGYLTGSEFADMLSASPSLGLLRGWALMNNRLLGGKTFVPIEVSDSLMGEINKDGLDAFKQAFVDMVNRYTSVSSFDDAITEVVKRFISTRLANCKFIRDGKVNIFRRAILPSVRQAKSVYTANEVAVYEVYPDGSATKIGEFTPLTPADLPEGEKEIRKKYALGPSTAPFIVQLGFQRCKEEPRYKSPHCLKIILKYRGNYTDIVYRRGAEVIHNCLSSEPMVTNATIASLFGASRRRRSSRSSAVGEAVLPLGGMQPEETEIQPTPAEEKPKRKSSTTIGAEDILGEFEGELGSL